MLCWKYNIVFFYFYFLKEDFSYLWRLTLPSDSSASLQNTQGDGPPPKSTETFSWSREQRTRSTGVDSTLQNKTTVDYRRSMSTNTSTDYRPALNTTEASSIPWSLEVSHGLCFFFPGFAWWLCVKRYLIVTCVARGLITHPSPSASKGVGLSPKVKLIYSWRVWYHTNAKISPHQEHVLQSRYMSLPSYLH